MSLHVWLVIPSLLLLYPDKSFWSVFCTKCGAQNADGVAFCYSCGNRLDGVSQSSVPPTLQNSQGPWIPAKSVQGKSAIIAAVLNFFFALGYLYLGYKKVLGVPAIFFVLLTVLIYIIFGLYTGGIVTFIFAVLLAIDGWQKGSGGKGFISAE
jgi:hypothetical protein